MLRREFGKYALVLSAAFGGGVLISPKLYSKKSFLRPPGALEEEKFLAACIKCGQCVQVCPYHSLSLLDIDALNSVGTPYIDAEKRGCYLCDLFPCVLACPTGSLSHDTAKPSDVRMGVAYVKNINDCLAFSDKDVSKESVKEILTRSNKNDREDKILKDVENYIGKKCSICADMCPYPNKEEAIEMTTDKEGKTFPKIKSRCVGCGVCVELCPPKAISIAPRKSYEEIYQ
jgi:ferredoxin-type protein NapG